MSAQQEYYPSEIASKAVIEFTTAFKAFADVEYAKALIADPRMSSNRGHFAACGINMRQVKAAKSMLPDSLPLMDAQRKAIDFLNALDHEMEIRHG